MASSLENGCFEIEIIQYYSKGVLYAAAFRIGMQSLIHPSLQIKAQHGQPLLKGSSQNVSTAVKTFSL